MIPKCPDFNWEFGVKRDMKTNPKRNQISCPRCPKSFQNGVPKPSQSRKISDSGHPRVLTAPKVAQGAPKDKNGPPGRQNGGNRPPQSQFGTPKMTTTFYFGNKKCLERQHPEANEPGDISAENNRKTQNKQSSKPSNRLKPKILKQMHPKYMKTNIQKLASQHTSQQR